MATFKYDEDSKRITMICDGPEIEDIIDKATMYFLIPPEIDVSASETVMLSVESHRVRVIKCKPTHGVYIKLGLSSTSFHRVAGKEPEKSVVYATGESMKSFDAAIAAREKDIKERKVELLIDRHKFSTFVKDINSVLKIGEENEKALSTFKQLLTTGGAYLLATDKHFHNTATRKIKEVDESARERLTSDYIKEFLLSLDSDTSAAALKEIKYDAEPPSKARIVYNHARRLIESLVEPNNTWVTRLCKDHHTNETSSPRAMIKMFGLRTKAEAECVHEWVSRNFVRLMKTWIMITNDTLYKVRDVVGQLRARYYPLGMLTHGLEEPRIDTMNVDEKLDLLTAK
jgi:hypothetical protein